MATLPIQGDPLIASLGKAMTPQEIAAARAAGTYNGTSTGAPTPAPQGTANPNYNPNAKAGTAGSLDPTLKTPTVITDANIRENTIPDINNRAAAALTAANGVVQGPAPAGSLRSANGNYVDRSGNQYASAPIDTSMPGAATQTPASQVDAQGSTGNTDTTAPANEYDSFLKSLFTNNQSTSTQGAANPDDPYLATLSVLKATSDKATQGLIDAAHQKFDERRAQLEATDAASKAGLMQALIANGEAQYAPVLAGGRITAAERGHILAMSNIDAEESAAVAQLQKAQADQDYQTMGKWLDHLDELKKDKIDVATKLSEQAAATTKAINDAKLKSGEDLQKTIVDLVTAARNNNAPASVINGILGAQDVAGAVTAAGVYGGGGSGMPGEYNRYVADATSRGQVPVDFQTYQDMDANRKIAVARASASSSSGASDPEGIAELLVQGLIAPSELSKYSRGAGGYNDILQLANSYSMSKYNKPFSIAQADRDYKFATNQGTQNTLNYLKSLVGTVDPTDPEGKKFTGGNLDELKTISNQITRTRFPALNDAAAWARLATGDPTIAQYQAVTTEVADQVAKILQGGGTGSGTSDAKLQQAINLFNTGFSKDQINGIIDALHPLLLNRAKSMVSDNPYLSDYAGELGMQPAGALSTGKTLLQQGANNPLNVNAPASGATANNPLGI